jgi:hypothetical protein
MSQKIIINDEDSKPVLIACNSFSENSTAPIPENSTVPMLEMSSGEICNKTSNKVLIIYATHEISDSLEIFCKFGYIEDDRFDYYFIFNDPSLNNIEIKECACIVQRKHRIRFWCMGSCIIY